jgi:hypothetical protein
MPVPDNDTVVGELLALLATVSVAERAPPLAGLNATLTVHDALTAMVEQLFVCVNSVLLTDTPDTVADAVPVLVIVTACVLVVLPTTVLANARLVGLALRIGPGATPVPERLTFVSAPPTVTPRVPLWLPAVVGANVTLKEQDAPAATLDPQLFVCAYWPLMLALTLCAEVPLLDTVTVCGLLVVLVAWDPKDRDVGVTDTLFSAWYGGHTGVGHDPPQDRALIHAPLPPLSTMVKLLEQV